MTFLRLFKNLLHRAKAVSPAKAYDLLAAGYDLQTDNPLTALDNELFTDWLNTADLEAKTVIDIGCGTGRHWDKLFGKGAASVTGYDVSAEMLRLLKEKYPHARAYLSPHRVPALREGNASCDIILSQLTIGYIDDLRGLFTECGRVLKPGGICYITDLHPGMHGNGIRTFRTHQHTLAIRSYAHAIPYVIGTAARAGLILLRQDTRMITEEHRPCYEKAGAMAAYENTRHTPVIYSLEFRKEKE